MNLLEITAIVLREAGKPLHYKELTDRILAQGLWKTKGKTPEATINAQLSVDLKENGTNSLFQRTERGIFALREWGLPEYLSNKSTPGKITQPKQVSPANLETLIWESVDILRGEMGPDEYSQYILGLFFLKRLSDVYEEKYRNLLQDALDLSLSEPEAKAIASDPDEHQFIVPPFAQWSNLKAATSNLGDQLNRAFTVLEEANPSLKGVFLSLDFNIVRLPNKTLKALIHQFDKLQLGKEQVPHTEVVSEIFQFLLNQFSEAAGKRGGDFHASGELIDLMVQLAQADEGMRVYDPSAGTGGLLLGVARHLEKEGGNSLNLSLFGEEVNNDTWALGKMNTLLSGLPDTQITNSNALFEPHFVENDKLVQFDRVITIPPFSMRSPKLDKLADDAFARFPYGISRIADFAYIQHIIASLKPDGRAVVMTSPGILFRGGREGEIRRHIVRDDLVEVVISLPSNILTATGLAPILLILNKAKQEEQKGKVLFVFADEMYELGKNRRAVMNVNHRQMIAQAIKFWTNQEKFAALISLEKIATNDYQLLPSEYVDLIDKDSFLGGTVKWTKLSDIADVHHGITRIKEDGKQKTPIIRGRDLAIVGLTVDDLSLVDVTGKHEKAIYSKIGDILIQSISNSPRTLFIDSNSGLDDVVVADSVLIIRLYPEYQNIAQYLTEYLNSDRGQTLIRYRGGGSMLADALRLTIHSLRNMQVPLPPKPVIALINELHEIETTFLDRVNRARRLRQQVFGIEDPAQVNAQLSTLSVDAQVLRESIVQIEDLSFQIRNFYPSALAYAYRTLDTDQSKAALYKQQLRVAENILAFLGSIGLALVAHNKEINPSDASLTNDLLEGYWQGGISPGDWLDIGRRTARLLRNDSFADVASFGSVWFKKQRGGSPSDFANLLLTLVQQKNAFKHDQDGLQDDPQYEEAVPIMKNYLRESFGYLAFLVRCPIRLVTRIRIEWPSGKPLLHTLLCTGDHPVLRNEEILGEAPLPDGKLFMKLANNTWVPLYPFLSAQYNSSSRAIETYMIDAWNRPGGKIRLKSFERGHVLDDTEDAKQVGYDLNISMNGFFQGL